MNLNRRLARNASSSFFGIALVGLSLGVLACGEEEVVAAAPFALPVKTIVVGGAITDETREYAARIEAFDNAEMAFEVPGRIVEFRVVEGDEVEKGQVMVRLDPRDFAADIAGAKATVARTLADYERYQKLFENGVAPVADLEAKKQEYEVSKAEQEKAVKALEDANLVAPFSGVVARKLVQDHENVRAKQTVLILQNASKLKVRTAVPESDMTDAKGGTSLDELTRRIRPSVELASLPGRRFPAAVYELSLTADPVTRTFDATMVFDQPSDANILSGMTAKVTIHPSGAVDGRFIPGAAVWSDDMGQPHVWKVDPQTSTVIRAPVTVGTITGDRIQITDGIRDGDEITTSGVQQLADGTLVRSLGEKIR